MNYFKVVLIRVMKSIRSRLRRRTQRYSMADIEVLMESKNQYILMLRQELEMLRGQLKDK